MNLYIGNVEVFLLMLSLVPSGSLEFLELNQDQHWLINPQDLHC